ncbi:YciI family protein [Enterovibrio makurazakiensis]|uniref:YciI family protein n=1 Tax=Enterovibrio makurazakiensis TaxID=2910232 RepID=UPI003D1CA3F2
MKEFMFIYQGGDPDWMKNTSSEEMAAIMKCWEDWMTKLQEADQLVTGGSPLHFEGKRVTPDMVITDIAAAEFKELVSGYSIVRADSLEEAAELGKSCPIFQSPGVSLEIRQVVKMS